MLLLEYYICPLSAVYCPCITFTVELYNISAIMCSVIIYMYVNSSVIGVKLSILCDPVSACFFAVPVFFLEHSFKTSLFTLCLYK